MYKISKLVKVDLRLYHTNDLAILWSISNKNTLYTTIKRYVQKGILTPIYKGLYSTIPVSQLDPLELGRAIIHSYCYLSTESILAQAGLISQATYAHTFVSNVSKKISVGSSSFVYRKLKDGFLVNPAGIIEQNGLFIATTERAVADMLYFNPRYHLDISGTVDPEKLKFIQKEVGYL